MTDTECLVAEMLDTRVKRATGLLPSRDGWMDAIDAQARWLDDPNYLIPPPRSRELYVYTMLGHLKVNPHDTEATLALVKAYVTKQDDGYDPFLINYSPDSIKGFVDDLVELAEEESVSTYKPVARVVRICGPRGCGKTFFENYVLTKYSREFDKRRLLWVRLNLADPFDGSLLHWIFAQTTKILMRYYDNTSQFYAHNEPKNPPIRVHERLRKFVEEQADPEQRDRLLDKINYMHSVFQLRSKHGGTRDIPIRADLVPEQLGFETFHMARDEGYSIVIVLDGLDRLEATLAAAERFKDLYLEAMQIAHRSDSLGALLVLVTRTDTVNMPVLSPVFTRVADKRKGLCAITFDNIFEARLAFIRDRVPRIAGRQGWRMDDWPRHLDQFSDFLKERDIELRRSEALEAFGQNRRAQMQVVQMTYLDYLAQERERPYLIVEALVKAGCFFPPRHYFYRTSENHLKHEDRKEGRNTVFDNHLLPPIFTYPYVDYTPAVESGLIPRDDYMLLGLRLLQLIHAHETRLLSRTTPTERLTLKVLVGLCSQLFDYPRELVLAMLQEYQQYEFVHLGSMDFPTPTVADALAVYSTSKTDYMLRHFMFDIAYLNLSAMRLPLATRVVSSDPPFIRAATPDSHLLDRHMSGSKRRELLLEWIFIKIANTTALFRLLQSLNEQQETTLGSRLSDVEGDYKQTVKGAMEGDNRVPGMFSFPDKMKRSIMQQSGLILKSIDESGQRRVAKMLRTYWDGWKDV